MKPRGSTLLFMGLGFVGLSACNVLFSLDDYAAPELSTCSSCAAARCLCAPNAPVGFEHARLRVAVGSDELCPQGTVIGVAMGQAARDTGCACKCDGPVPGAACALAVFSNDSCSGAPDQTITAADSCVAFSSTPPVWVAVRPAAGSTCTATADARAPDFDVRVLACLDQLPGSSECDARTTCTAALDPPFDPSPCIVAKPGAQVACPDSYSHKYVFATGFDDQRSCDASGCACTPPICPSTTVSLCSDVSCADAGCPEGPQAFSNCRYAFGPTHGKVVVDGKTQGECEPTGEAGSDGALTATGSLVVCCRDALETTD